MAPDVTGKEGARVCVVGAGPAGLAIARALKSANIPFEVFERNPGVGGIWNPDHPGSPMYDTAHFISSRDALTSTYLGHPFPAGTATYPNHAEVKRYLEAFAASEGLIPHILFDAPVERAIRTERGWRVQVAGESGERFYTALICASGTLWDPICPTIPGAETFAGKIRHSVSYRSADELRGRRVLVVGAGNSGVDIVCDAARSALSASLSLRRGYWFLPKFIGGRPTDLFFRDRESMPGWANPPDAEALLTFLVGHPSRYGLPSPDHAPFASHPIMNSEVLHHIGHGRIRPQGGISHLERQDVVYADGAREPVDEIILATGYRATVPYLPETTFNFAGGNRPHLWMRLFHPTDRSLYGVGFLETNASVYRLFDLGAELVAGHILAGMTGLPARARLDAAISSGFEPDLSGHTERIHTQRHVGYVDSRAYERALQQLISDYVGDEIMAERRSHTAVGA